MSKECKGKYHGTAIKYINDDEKYCLICQQQIELKKKKRNEIIAGIGGTVISIVVGVIVKALTGGNSEGNTES